MRNQILLADCIDGLEAVPAASVPMTLTSPPYERLRLFGGQEWDFEFFTRIAEELYRVTIPGGVVVWVVADAIIGGGESGMSAKQKLYFQRAGFSVHQTMVMQRAGSRWPSKVRYGDSLEYAFVLSKGKPRTINLLRDKPNKHAGMVRMFNRRGLDGRLHPAGAAPPVRDWGVRSAVWHYATGGWNGTPDEYANDHPALMPERMAEDHILSWSRAGDLILDPMAGAATTCKMALLNHRDYLGFEVHEPYHRLAVRRMEDAHAQYRWRLDDWLVGS
jgi:site-specific DNA-methyltransferase (adenine-specific)